MIKLNHVNKFYHKNKANEIHVLNEINLDLGTTGLVAILGASGSGKTTLLNALCGLDKIDNGIISIENNEIKKYQSRIWDDIRNEYFGYIFQNYNLFDEQTVFQNVAFSLEILGIKDQELIKARTNEALAAVQMAKYKNRLAKNLSGGEQQRVAIARAIVKDAKFIIADEPTGNLDQKNTIRIMTILKEIAKTKLVIMVTHEKMLANVYADRIIHLSDGSIINDTANANSEGMKITDERIIYLGDMPFQENLPNNFVDLTLYSDEGLQKSLGNIKLKLIVKGQNIYILPEVKNYQIEIVDKDSLMEINEGKKEEVISEPFILPVALGELAHKRRHFSLGIWRFFKKGISDIMMVSRFKKSLFMGFVFASLLLTITIGLYRNVTIADESEFMNDNRDLVRVNLTYKQNYDEIINEQLALPNVYGFASPFQSSSITTESFFQRARYGMFQNEVSISGTVVNYQSIEGYNGPIPQNGEIVIDRLVVEKLNKNNSLPMSEKMIINQQIKINNKTFKIIGITNGNNLTFYATPFDSLIVNLAYNEFAIFDLTEVTTDITALNDNEILVSNKNKQGLAIGDKKEIGNKDYLVKGFYTDDIEEGYVFSYQGLSYYVFYRLIFAESGYFLLSKTPVATSKKLDRSQLNVYSVYEEAYKAYQNGRMEIFRVLFTLVAIMLITPLLMLFFMMRSNMIARIREIGIYRALGLRKINLYKMYLGEILAITTIFSITGFFLALLVMTKSNQNPLTKFFRIDLITTFGSLGIVVIINVIVGLLPILRLLRHTPREILSKYDI